MNSSQIRQRWSALLAVSAFAIAACGGGSDGESQSDDVGAAVTNKSAAPTEANGNPEASSDEVGNEPAGADADDGAPFGDDVGGPGDYEPGDVVFRSVNLLDEPVDVYVRTVGFVRAFLIYEDVAPGEITGFVAPPEDGRYVITEAGAGDATCVIECDHFVAELFVFPDDGPTHTVLLYEDASGDRSAYDLWEEAPTDRSGSANYMEPADSSTALGIVHTDTIGTDEFLGYRITVDNIDNCLEPYAESAVLIGGNQTVPFALGNATEFSIHDNGDKECAEAPVGGPFPFNGAPGSRDHIILTGEPGAVEALVLPMANTAGSTDLAGDDAGSTGSAGDVEAVSSPERDIAMVLMADEAAANFALDATQSSYLGALIVDAIGSDIRVTDGVLVDLDTLDESVNALAGQAVVESIDACGIDPAVLGA